MCSIFFLVTDAHKGLAFFDGCAQRFFEERVRARGTGVRKNGRITRMRATYMTDACNPIDHM